ncbi:MMPL family transporter, partial [Candidatus Saccharibacteria bacterium]|nr:MMPL family transporter [Calditrichia bacterium]NIV71962.1 MMPL family transporter [Calditrichia bacterium]NIV98752.1 MMPL family transporter [Candidatus Saccharibacteria bacterium]NIW79018.1 MMPL family transporter [Calditrichia bacterium]
ERRAIFITATQKTETNIFQVMEALKARVEAYKSQLPGSMSLHYAFDQSESVAHRVNGFFSNLLQGVVLVGIVVLIAMGFRSAIIVMVVIPLSIFIALGFLDLSQYGLQQMTIAGLIIALGLLVDNAIVVSENVARFLRQGYSRREAAFQGTSQIGWAVVSSTATTVLAFLPMIMIQNVTGDFIRSMPVMVIYALLASLFVSLTLTPFLVSKFLKTHQTSKIGLGQQLLQKFIEARYRPRLARVLPRPKLVLGIAMVVFLGSLALFPIIGVSFFPKAEKPQFVINIDAPEGTSIYKTEAIAAEVEAALSQQPQVSHFATNIGRGNPRIYYNVIPKNEKGNHAQILVQLRKYDLEAFNRVIGSLREKFANFPGAEIKVKEFEQGPPVEAPIAIRILGEDLRVLRDIAHDVEKMIATTNGTLNLNNPLRTRKTDLHV